MRVVYSPARWMDRDACPCALSLCPARIFLWICGGLAVALCLFWRILQLAAQLLVPGLDAAIFA
jgi:hypothetical protein